MPMWNSFAHWRWTSFSHRTNFSSFYSYDSEAMSARLYRAAALEAGWVVLSLLERKKRLFLRSELLRRSVPDCQYQNPSFELIHHG